LPGARYIRMSLGFGLILSLFIGGVQAQTPYYEHRKHTSEYNGPGRDEPVPEDLTEIRIGYFGPADAEHPTGGDNWLAATVAVEQVNASGGYHGIPFKLIQGWSDNPWGTGILRVTRMVYEDRVWAIIGSIDGPSTHLAEQVVAKARVPLVNPGSTDKTANLANVPWLFSFLPGEHIQVPLLADALLACAGDAGFGFLSSVDHDSRVFIRELTRYLTTRKRFPKFHVVYDPRQPNCLETLEQFPPAGIRAVVIAAPPDEGPVIVERIRRWGDGVRILADSSFGRSFFLDRIGQMGDGIILPYPGTIHSPQDILTESFRQRWNRTPDFAARQTYDAVLMLAEAVQRVGLNRVRIREELRRLSPWSGSNGQVEWDPLGQNRRPVPLVEIAGGKIRPFAGLRNSRASPPQCPAGE